MTRRIEVKKADAETVASALADATEEDLAAFKAVGDPQESLEYMLSITANPEAFYVDGELVAVIGLYEPGVIVARGVPWLIKTKAALKHSLLVLAASKEIVKHWQSQYDVLGIFVLSSLDSARRFAEWLGFKDLGDVDLEGVCFTYYERRV